MNEPSALATIVMPTTVLITDPTLPFSIIHLHRFSCDHEIFHFAKTFA